MRFFLFCIALTALAQSPQPRDLKLKGDRFQPLTWDLMTPEQRTLADHILSGERASLGGPFNVYLRSPELGEIEQTLGAYLRFHSSIPRKLNEFAIIITGRFWSAQYEWYAHKPLALQAGLNPAIVDALAAGQRPPGMQRDEAAVYNFCTEILNQKQVSDATFQAAKDSLGERGVVDLMAVFGYYNLVSIVLNVDRYPLPDGAKPELKPLP
jgi:4-carboxymuconolactone decarboxylase